MRTLVIYSLLVLTWLMVPSAGSAQTNNGETQVNRVRARIFAIEADAERLERKLTELDSEKMRLSDEINRLELERALTEKRVTKHELELEQAVREIAENEKHEIALRKDAQAQEARIGLRLRELYKRGNLGYAQLFLKQARRAELLTAYHYARILTERDNQILQSFRATLARLKDIRANLDRMRRQAEDARALLAEQEAQLQRLLKKRAGRLRSIRQQTSKQQQLLTDLDLERQELQIMLRRLTESDFDPFEVAVPIKRYRGRLNWPAKGRIKRRFGIYRDPEFATKRRHNGVLLRVKKGQPVRGIYSGRVIFADWFKSYGNLIIIDHRGKITSFYAHCDRLLVKKGDYVETDQIIAYSGDTGSLQGPMLHLEVRNAAKPENPEQWLKPHPQRRKKRR